MLIVNSETASGVPTAVMNYTNYEANIVLKYKVKLVGWPHDKFVSPYNINTVDELRNLRDALHCGSCFWMGLSSREVAQYVKAMDERTAAGEVIGKKRKERSDKGAKKGPRNQHAAVEDDLEDERGSAGDPVGERPSKRQKVTARAKGKENVAGKTTKRKRKSAKSQVPPSREVISDTDLDDDN